MAFRVILFLKYSNIQMNKYLNTYHLFLPLFVWAYSQTWDNSIQVIQYGAHKGAFGLAHVGKPWYSPYGSHIRLLAGFLYHIIIFLLMWLCISSSHYFLILCQSQARRIFHLYPRSTRIQPRTVQRSAPARPRSRQETLAANLLASFLYCCSTCVVVYMFLMWAHLVNRDLS